ncbi:MAG: 8-amino-7-oxononanoate synthase [Planctomycetota bacterium]
MADFDHLRRRLDQLEQLGRRRTLSTAVHRGVWLLGRDGRPRVNFGSNDYLGLAADRIGSPSQRDEPLAGGAAASALVSGWTDRHQDLAERIAALEQTESATLFPSGYAACSGVVATLAAEGDLILSDRLNHASLIDGCRLSRADRQVFPHRDTHAVQAILKSQRAKYENVWIVTDSVFSMDGHVAPLETLCNLAERYKATMIVDEAHATGVMGATGSGACEALGVKDRVPIRIGTLSKAIGSQGGFVAGPTVVIDYLINHCRSLIYSTALAPAAVAAAWTGIGTFSAQPRRRARVGELARRLRERLGLIDEDSEDSIESSVPIVPLIVGTATRAVEIARHLSDQGFYVPAIRPPTVPEGTSRLRVSLSASHTDTMLDELADTICDRVLQ